MVAWRGWVRVVYWVGLSWFGGAGPNLFPGLVSVSLCVSCAPELPSLASYLCESLVSPLVLSLCYPFHRCRAYGDGAPLHCSASSASASSVHVCARLRASSLPSVDLVVFAVVCRAFRPSSVTCRYVARRHFPVCVVGSSLRCCCCGVVVHLRMPGVVRTFFHVACARPCCSGVRAWRAVVAVVVGLSGARPSASLRRIAPQELAHRSEKHGARRVTVGALTC